MLTRQSTARSRPVFSFKLGTGYKRVRKALITLFIVASLSAQALNNLRVGYLRPQADTGPVVQTAARVYNNARAGLAAFAAYTGTNAYWRLFSPINKVHWWHTAEALYEDGSVITVHVPLQLDRTLWQELIVDHREVKINLNMWYRKELMAAYAQHLCLTYPSPSGPPTYIRFSRFYQDILPQQQARQHGLHLNPQVRNFEPELIECR